MPYMIVVILLMISTLMPVSAQERKSRDQLVREDRSRVTSDGFWIYNDLPEAFRRAKETGKPMVVVLRCIPCEECVKLDDDLVDTDPVLRPLLEQFVCVRVVSTNGLDLSLFQFDTDQSFAVFFLNADRTIYGRFGTRSHRTEWVGDVSLKGLEHALRGALELHASYPANRNSLMGKTGPKPTFARPELFPALREKYTDSLNYSGDVVRSCIHCHQIGDAVRDLYRERSEPIPESVLNPYPHPKSIGLVLDPSTRGTLKDVQANSPGADAGLISGDQILTMNNQPVLSLADIQWVLHSVPSEGGAVTISFSRQENRMTTTLQLPEGWRRLDDISWRVTSWGLRRMATGGLLLEPLSPEERRASGIPDVGMALRVKHVGQYGAHAAAKNAGFQQGDVLVSFDGTNDLLTDSDVLRHGVTKRKPGDRVPVEIIRNGTRKTLHLPMQK